MTLLENYLKAVKGYLPASQRDDIIAELSANLHAQFEDKEEEVGRSLTQDEIEAILRGHGSPMLVAGRYRTDDRTFSFGRQIIGPVLFSKYLLILGINVAIAACVVIASAAFYRIPTYDTASSVAVHVLVQFGIVTAIFALIQRHVDKYPNKWEVRRPNDIYERGTKVRRGVSRVDSVASLVFLIAINLWLIPVVLRSPHLLGPYLKLAPIWQPMFAVYIILVLVELIRNGVNLARPEWLRFRAIAQAIGSGIVLASSLVLLMTFKLVEPANAGVHQAVELARIVNIFAYATVICAAVISLPMLLRQLRSWVRLRDNAATVVAIGALGLLVFAGGTAAQASSCATASAPFAPIAGAPQWNGWGADVSQRRFQPAEMAQLSATQVPRLKLKWAFGFPGITRAYGQPTVFGGRVFVGSDDHHVYSLDAKNGCLAWTFDAGGSVRTAITVGRVGESWAAYFGDQSGYAYALNAATGVLIWKTRIDNNPYVIITGAPVLADGMLFVPASASEGAVTGNPMYPCCRFRGSISALDAATGKTVWKSYTIAQTPKPSGKNRRGVQLWAPSGAAVWSAPTIDLRRRAVYVGTGDDYSEPVASTSDAIMAFDMESGKLLWSRQMTKGDAQNVSCGMPDPYDTNCPKANGPDYDFGSSPILETLPNGRRALIAGQKSGMVYALDPDRRGATIWQRRVGRGSKLGGVQWGSAADARAAYVAVSDEKFAPAAAGTPGAQNTPFGIPFLLDPNAGGGLFALDVRTGSLLWKTPNPGCNNKPGCSPAQSAAVTAIPGVVFSGGVDGHMRAYSSQDGAIMWDIDTERDYATVNGVKANGGSIDGPGATVAGGMLYVNSGYGLLGSTPGNVLLAFSVDGL
jgi:polyvinyl alcohol dehydrogenase (cytochrome)